MTKFYIIGALIAILVGLGIAIKIQHDKIKQLNIELSISFNNSKAYEAERDSLRKNTIQFQYTIDQLNHNNDSLINRINEIRKQLRIKDKQSNELQYFTSTNNKKDSIIIRDTIFQYGAIVDTLIGDKWSKLHLHTEYPNVINVNYSFNNETLIVTHNSKVPINTPKKCWIGRLFQKKQNIVEIDIIEENPYCEIKEKKFIEIIQ